MFGALNFANNLFGRGASFVGIGFASDTFIADRFFLSALIPVAGSLVDSLRISGGPPFELFDRESTVSLELTNQSAVAVIPDDEDAVIAYIVEGFDILSIFKKSFTIQFAVRSSVVGIYNVLFQSFDNSENYTGTFEILSANVWQKVIINVPANPDIGNWDFGQGAGLKISIVLSSGSDRFGTTDVWGQIVGVDMGIDSNQVNWLENIGSTFALQFLKLEPGDIATALPITNISNDADLQNRYFQKSYDNGIAPGSVTVFSPIRFTAVPHIPFFNFAKKVREESVSSLINVTLFSPATGASGVVRNITTGADVVPSNIVLSEYGFTFDLGAGVNPNDNIELHWTVDSEIT